MSPQRGFAYHIDAEWNIGMVEKWNGGYEKMSAIFFIKDLLPIYPIFSPSRRFLALRAGGHHSSFPIPQDI
jgi:hypothetical protein